MSNPSPIEIEIKSLLGSEANAAQFRQALLSQEPNQNAPERQLNHYFQGTQDLELLVENLETYLKKEQFLQLQELAGLESATYSVRTRQTNDTVLIVIKVSLDETTSSNGITRLEFEAETPKLDLDQLDGLILESGFEYQAKWSRVRESYHLPTQDVTITIDKNAGYGYLAEFEKVVTSPDETSTAKALLETIMADLSVEELQQARLGRMFEHYNANWQDYYGTDEIFVIE